MEQQQGDRSKSNWEDLVTVTQQGSDLAVRVQFLDFTRPQYSFEIGRMRDGKFVRFMRALLSTNGGRVSIQHLDGEVLKVLVAEAERLIEADAEKRESLRRVAAPAPALQDDRRPARPTQGRGDRSRQGRGDDRRRDQDPWR